LFERHLPEVELPTIVAEERWETLPPDPRSDAQLTGQLQQSI
jgi:hypothetical protein